MDREGGYAGRPKGEWVPWGSSRGKFPRQIPFLPGRMISGFSRVFPMFGVTRIRRGKFNRPEHQPSLGPDCQELGLGSVHGMYEVEMSLAACERVQRGRPRIQARDPRPAGARVAKVLQ